MYDKVLQVIQENGPCLPVDVASKLGINSFLAKAFMDELVNQGKLKAGDIVGSTPIFLLPGQEELAAKRAQELSNIKRTVAGHVGKEVDMSPEAVAKREHFKRHFEKSLNEPEKPKESRTVERRITEVVSENLQESTLDLQKRPFEPLDTIDQQLAKSAPKRNIIDHLNKMFKRESIKPQKEKKQEGGAYVNRILQLFNTDKARVIEEIDVKKKSAELIVDFPSSIGAMRYYVEIKDKQAIGKADVSLAYTEGINRKLPALVVSRGKLARNVESYVESLGSLFKFKQMK